MSKKFIFILLMFLSIVLVGCDVLKPQPEDPGTEEPNPEDPGTQPEDPGTQPEDPGTQPEDPEDPEQPGNPDFENQFNTIAQYLREEIPYFVDEDVEMMEYYSEYDAYIEWESSDEDVFDFAGGVTVNRTKAVEVTLTFNVTIGEDSKQGELKVIVTPQMPDKLEERFAKQFSVLITRDYEVQTVYYELFEFEWYSTNTDVFTNEGVYVKPNNDVPIEIKYTLRCKDYEGEEQSISSTVAGYSDAEKLDEVENWLKTEVLLDLYFTEGVKLPDKYEKLGIDITWESTNPDVISADGKITHYVYERYVTVLGNYKLANGSAGTTKFECIVSALDTSNMTQAQILENFLSSIALTSYDGLVFGGNGGGCNTTYGHLFFYENEDCEIDVNYIPVDKKNRTQIKQDVKLIVCHDTGNMSSGATAAANANYVRSGYGGSSTGWHYTVGNDGIYQTVPDDEVAYQANGSSDQYTTFIKTNVKATWQKPNFTVSEDGFILINGIKSNIELPDKTKKLATDGPVWYIGSDGYYYIAKLWYCSSHGYNATQGGNANAVGIESAVNNGSDYLLTCRIFSKLVAELVLKHDLDLSRVVQHNTTSGKDCPNAMRSTNFWYTFKDMINMEMFAKQNFKGLTFEWKGTGAIDNTGRITKGTTAESVSYSVSVKNGTNVVLSKAYTTLINQK